MLRIPDFILDYSVFIYPSVTDAEQGKQAGGTGFVVAYETQASSWLYVVTNRHVVDGGGSVVRFNTYDGKADAIEFKPSDWTRHDTHDLAAIELKRGGPDPFTHIMQAIPHSLLLTRETHVLSEVGPGDETFMVGRFMYADGGSVNRPSVRFGRISMNPGCQFVNPTVIFRRVFWWRLALFTASVDLPSMYSSTLCSVSAMKVRCQIRNTRYSCLGLTGDISQPSPN
jgi:hypothetical protein